MNMTGGEIPMSVNLRLSSMPQTPFKLMSSTRHAASRRIRALDKAVDGRESLDVESTHFEQPLDGTQDAPVIIKNEYSLAQIHDARRRRFLLLV
jgi:hypothetical protein